MTYRTGPVSKSALTKIQEQGLDLPAKPDSLLPGLPDSITDMSDTDLMESYSEFVAWSDYVTSQAAAAAVDERAAQSHVESLEARAMLKEWTGKSGDRVTLQKARAASDPEIVEARQQFDEAYAYRKLVESIANSMERNAQMLSRELTRRTSFDRTPRRSRHT